MSTQHAFLDHRARGHRARILRHLRRPELVALAFFAALLAAEIALIVSVAPVVDPLSLIYGGT